MAAIRERRGRTVMQQVIIKPLQPRCARCKRFALQAVGNLWSSPRWLVIRSATYPISQCCGAELLRGFVPVSDAGGR